MASRADAYRAARAEAGAPRAVADSPFVVDGGGGAPKAFEGSRLNFTQLSVNLNALSDDLAVRIPPFSSLVIHLSSSICCSWSSRRTSRAARFSLKPLPFSGAFFSSASPSLPRVELRRPNLRGVAEVLVLASEDTSVRSGATLLALPMRTLGVRGVDMVIAPAAEQAPA